MPFGWHQGTAAEVSNSDGQLTVFTLTRTYISIKQNLGKLKLGKLKLEIDFFK